MAPPGVLPAFLAVPAIALVLAWAEPRVRPQAVATPAHRAVLYPPLLAAYLTVDDGADHVGAASRFQLDEWDRGLLRAVFSTTALPAAATLGRDTAVPGDPERILALHPDAVFSWTAFAAPLRRIGAPLIALDNNATQDDSARTEAVWRLCAAVAGQTTRVEQLIARYRSARAAVLAAAAPLPDHPRVLYVYGTDPLLVAFPGSQPDRWLTAVGAVNAAAGLRGAHLTVEELLAREPQIIILSGFAADDAMARLSEDPAWRGVPAVRARHIYRQPIGSGRMDGLVDEPLMLRWLAEIVHPDGMPRTFRQALKNSYAATFGVALSDQAVDATLRIDENADSAGYDRFTDPRPAPTDRY